MARISIFMYSVSRLEDIFRFKIYYDVGSTAFFYHLMYFLLLLSVFNVNILLNLYNVNLNLLNLSYATM